MTNQHETLLKRYLQLPDRLEAALAGLDEQQFDLALDEDWSIRAYVHHTVEGEYLWQVLLRAMVGLDGIELPFQWYFLQEQKAWATKWGYDRRPVGPALDLLRANTRSLVEFLRCVPEAWDCSGRVRWPGAEAETRLTVREVVLIHLRHLDGHTADIQAIREKHGC
ncbi:MAG: DinB family protein [Anaerolineales bacterium]|nr:DinB family protein [Anaerolineales bacterium]